MNKTITNWFLVGCGGHAKSVADVLLHNTPTAQLVFVDENARAGETLWGFPVQSSWPEGLDETWQVHVALGDNATREARTRSVLQHLARESVQSIVASNCYHGFKAQLGAGCFVAQRVHCGPEVSVGEGCILNTACVLEHEVQVGAFSHVSVNATLCGKVQVGQRVFVGAGATVKHNLSVCSDVTLGAGAVVVANITEPGTYVGCPARKLCK
jgi:UDP-N-acetylbacillosamine N-acetyltransferase